MSDYYLIIYDLRPTMFGVKIKGYKHETLGLSLLYPKECFS